MEDKEFVKEVRTAILLMAIGIILCLVLILCIDGQIVDEEVHQAVEHYIEIKDKDE